MLTTFPFSYIVSLVYRGFCGDIRTGTIECLSFFGLGVHSYLGIFSTILVPLGASPTFKACVPSSMVIYTISITSSNVAIVGDQISITRVIKGSINALHRPNKALLKLCGVSNNSICK